MNTNMFNDPSHFSKSESCIMQVQRSKSNFLHRGMCSPLDGVIGRRESSAEVGERSAKLQRGAEMPGQRWAGQLVYIYKVAMSVCLHLIGRVSRHRTPSSRSTGMRPPCERKLIQTKKPCARCEASERFSPFFLLSVSQPAANVHQ